MVYHIKLEKFEGPLDLLLELIEGQKLDIAEVSLAKVADQYLEYIEQKKDISLENLAGFLTVASKLILIKSKALLPVLDLSEEEEKEIKDLEHQLSEYKKFKDISKKIQALAESSRNGYSREEFSGIGAFFFPPENINAYDLKKYFVKVLNEIPAFEKLEEEMVKEVITLEEKMSHLHLYLKEKIETSFSELVAASSDKVDIIVSFLAMLEMVKQRIVNVEQNSLFQEIKMKINN